MELVVLALRLACSLLFTAAVLLKLSAPRSLSASLQQVLGISSRDAGTLAWAVAVMEVCLAVGLLLPGTWAIASIGVLGWTVGAVAYQAASLSVGAGDCGCLAGWDPLRPWGPSRRLAYIAPIAIPGAVLAAMAVTRGIATSSPMQLAALGVVAAGLLVVPFAIQRRARRITPSPPHQQTASLARRDFLRRAATSVAAVVMAPLLSPALALASTPCGPYECIRYYVVCICCGNSGGTSCDGCYRYICRWCYSGGQGGQQCYYVSPGWCYTNICSPYGRRYVSNCGCCGGCPV